MLLSAANIVSEVTILFQLIMIIVIPAVAIGYGYLVNDDLHIYIKGMHSKNTKGYAMVSYLYVFMILLGDVKFEVEENN